MLDVTTSAGQLARLARLSVGGATITAHLHEALDALAQEMVQSVQEHMHFQMGYETGALRESITAERDGLDLRVGSAQPYAAFVEYGTGQRGAASGVATPEGYSYGSRPGMSAEPYLAPALEEMQPAIELYMSEAVAHSLTELAR